MCLRVGEGRDGRVLEGVDGYGRCVHLKIGAVGGVLGVSARRERGASGTERILQKDYRDGARVQAGVRSDEWLCCWGEGVLRDPACRGDI